MTTISDYALESLPMHIQVAPEWQVTDTYDVVNDRLTKNGLIKEHLKSLKFEVIDDTLVLTGRLPSFYLKQVLQTILQDLPGVSCIHNRVEVVSFQELRSETTCTEEPWL
jgi:hypothetical protein